MRIGYIDTARVFSIYWIVFVSHLISYLDVSIKTYWCEELYDITRSCLAAMMFISGYLLSKNRFDSWDDVKSFYFRRAKRFYLLYSVSAITLYYLHFNEGYSMLFTTLLGISSYIPPQPGTLWFLSMLMSFYLITPLLAKLLNNRSFKKSAFFIFLLGLALCFFEYFFSFDKRLHIHLLCYAIGFRLGGADLLPIILNKIWLGIIVVAISVFIITYRCTGNFVYDVDAILGLFSLLYLSKWVSTPFITKIMLFLSYGTMCVYLFHRQIFIVYDYICRHYINQTGSSGYTSLWFAIMVIIPSTIIFSYLIQLAYDRICTQ